MTAEQGDEIGRWKNYPFGMLAEGGASTGSRMKFTGHERDEGLELDYMLARNFAPALGRFLSVDPVGGTPGNPQTWNSYSYVAGNPMRFIDPTGETFTVTAVENEAALRAFVDFINAHMVGQELKVDSSGNATLVTTNAQAQPTEQQAAVAELLSMVINDTKNTKLTVSENSATVIGEFSTGVIDIADVLKLGDGPGSTAIGALGHEIAEQYGKQVLGQGYPLFGAEERGAHRTGIDWENRINGSTREKELDDGLKLDKRGLRRGKMKIPYLEDGRLITVIIKVRRGNVVKVRPRRR